MFPDQSHKHGNWFAPFGIWEKDKTSFKNIQEEFDDIILHSDFNSTSLISDLNYEDDDDPNFLR